MTACNAEAPPKAPQTMTAAILYGREDVRIEQRPVPSPGPGEALVAVEAALTDGTDLKVYRRGYHARMIVPPAIFGHEFAGSIAAVGPGVEDWPVGTRVVAANSAPCGDCYHCHRGQESLCDDLLFINGAYAQYVVIPERVVRRNLLTIPSGLSSSEAALTEPLACVVKGIRGMSPRPGDSIAIIGSGPIGLMAARVAVLAGCRVILIGRRQEQLEIGSEWGAEVTIGANLPEDLPGAIREVTAGRGPELVFEATGSPAMWEMAPKAVCRGGRVNLFGGCPAGTTASFDTGLLHYGEITLQSTFHHTPADIRTALSLISKGDIKPRRLFDSVEPLQSLPNVLKEMDARRRTLKTVIKP